MQDMDENQNFQRFRNDIDSQLNEQSKYDKLKAEEFNLHDEIKKIKEHLKTKQNEFTQEAKESSDEIK